MIINKQSSLCLVFLPLLEKFPRAKEGCSAGTESVVLFKSHQFNLMESGVLSVTGQTLRVGFQLFLSMELYIYPRKSSQGGLTPS